MKLTDLIDDRPDDGVFRVHRDIFTDPRIFAAELKHIFEGGWVFLGLEAQAAGPHDFFTTMVGRVPVLVQRDGAGVLRLCQFLPAQGRTAGAGAMRPCPSACLPLSQLEL